MTAKIQRTTILSLESMVPLVTESELQGWKLVRRLIDDYVSGINRFDADGECLFLATSDGAVVGVCGLNVDPYSADPDIGRVRHLYVLPAHRRTGVGKQLVQAVISQAHSRFGQLSDYVHPKSSSRQAVCTSDWDSCPPLDIPDATHVLGIAFWLRSSSSAQ